MNGFVNLVIPAIDMVLRLVGAACLVAAASFYIWWRWL